MTNILILNFHSSANAGDQALLETAIQGLRTHFPAAEITVACNDETSQASRAKTVGSLYALCTTLDREQGIHWRPLALPVYLITTVPLLLLTTALGRPLGISTRQRTLITAYQQADIVISCAGGFLYSSGKLGLPLLISLYTLWLAVLSKTPLFILPQSIGPLWRTRDQRWVAALLKRTTRIQVREETSFALVKALVPDHPNVSLLADLALAYAPPAQPHVLPNLPRPWIGVTVIDWGAQNKHFSQQATYEAAVADALSRVQAQVGGTLIFIPQVTGPTANQDDRLAAQRVSTALAKTTTVHTVTDALPAPQLFDLYGQLDCLLGTRMHSVIFSSLQHVPFVGIAYQPKLQGLARQLNVANWVVPIEACDAPQLTTLLTNALTHQTVYQAQLAQALGPYQALAHSACAQIKADYNANA